MKPGYTYIMGCPTGTLYIGVTSDIYIRVLQHKNGAFEGFSKQYNCTRLLATRATNTSANPSPAKSNSKAGAAKRS